MSERMQEWKRRLQTEEETTFKASRLHQVKFSPAERIRYEENINLGKEISQLFASFASRQQVTREMLVEEASRLRVRLSPPQWKKVHEVMDRMLEDLEMAEKHPREIDLQAIDRAFHKFEGFTLSITDLGPGRVVLGPFGTIAIHIDNEADWSQRMGSLSRGTRGFHLCQPQYALPNHAESTNLIRVANPHNPEEEEIIDRTVFIYTEGRSEEDIRKTREHEIAHVFFSQWIEPVITVRENNTVMAAAFMNMKNELLSYLLNEKWQFFLFSLFNKYGHDEKVFLDSIVDDAKQEYLGRFKFTPEKAHKIAKRKGFYIWTVSEQIARLNLAQSSEFEQAYAAVLVSQSLKELVYHLSKIGPFELDLASMGMAPPHAINPSRLRHAILMAREGYLSLKQPTEILDIVNDQLNRLLQAPGDEEQLKRFQMCKVDLEKLLTIEKRTPTP